MLEKKKGVIIQQFCDGLHWHNLVLFGPEARAYYWDPFGTPDGAKASPGTPQNEFDQLFGRISICFMILENPNCFSQRIGMFERVLKKDTKYM